MKKYELTNNVLRLVGGRQLRQIRAIRCMDNEIPGCYIAAGELGGYVESEKNLAQDDASWIDAETLVYDSAVVSGSALVRGSVICDNAIVTGDARLIDVSMRGNTVVRGMVSLNQVNLQDNAWVINDDDKYLGFIGIDLAGEAYITDMSHVIESSYTSPDTERYAGISRRYNVQYYRTRNADVPGINFAVDGHRTSYTPDTVWQAIAPHGEHLWDWVDEVREHAAAAAEQWGYATDSNSQEASKREGKPKYLNCGDEQFINPVDGVYFEQSDIDDAKYIRATGWDEQFDGISNEWDAVQRYELHYNPDCGLVAFTAAGFGANKFADKGVWLFANPKLFVDWAKQRYPHRQLTKLLQPLDTANDITVKFAVAAGIM